MVGRVFNLGVCLSMFQFWTDMNYYLLINASSLAIPLFRACIGTIWRLHYADEGAGTQPRRFYFVSSQLTDGQIFFSGHLLGCTQSSSPDIPIVVLVWTLLFLVVTAADDIEAMEAIATLSLVCNAVQVISFAGEVFQLCRSVYEDGTEPFQRSQLSWFGLALTKKSNAGSPDPGCKLNSERILPQGVSFISR